MIVILQKVSASIFRNRIWLTSLAAAAAINFTLFWLAGLAPVGRLAPTQHPPPESTYEIVIRRRAPPPPDLDALAMTESPPTILPPRFRPRQVDVLAAPRQRPDQIPSRLRLNLNPCDPDDDEARRKPDCDGLQDWRRADRDASELLGENAQGYTVEEIAVARGWIRPKPRTGQDAMAATTDATLPESIFKDPPFPAHAIEQTAGR